jgi:MarR family transcriptional regulator, lower aerobic nicotinate degradation pathway regulator
VVETVVAEAATGTEDGGFSPDRQIGFMLRRAYQLFHANLSARFAQFGITPQQFATLAKIREVGSVSQNQLGRLVSMDPAAIHGVIRRLSERGYINQDRMKGDKRLLMLSLSSAGRALVEAAIPLARDSQRASLAPLSAVEAETLDDLLTRLCHID